ncbi:MAG: glycoside hydrolase family 3 C-terminal domain-containing protein [Spirochaetaceae bacterium]|jgi:beta-glucosidase|nr:glycoside hydrolase family 3 C-terminal domain-containing protein [Spirochaetaceae bacterium]
MDNEQRISELIAAMTLEEKVSQLSYTSPAIERLGIPEYNWWNECLHGVARSGLATVFPQAIALAATFDETFVQKVAEAIADEARAKYHQAIKQGNRQQYCGLTFWTPNINIFRDPRWGRGQETYGEDPYLTSRIGTAFVQGLQGPDKQHLKVAACAKHFAVHSGPEKLRHEFNAQVSPKDLHETYLPAFKALVEAGVESVMGAYNRTLDEPCCGSHFLLQKLLRDTWRFEGHVTSDCWAIRDFHEHHKITATPEESAALALNAGCDLNCGCIYPYLTVAHKKGLVSEEAIDTAVRRLLRTRFKLGMFDPPEADPYSQIGTEVIDSEQHRSLALEAARKSIVLLKNDNNLLPLSPSVKKILAIGPSVANSQVLLGNYHGITDHLVTILEGLTAKTRGKFDLVLDYHPGCMMYDPNHNTGWTVGMAESADLIIAAFGLDFMMEGEEGDAVASDSKGDRDTIELPSWQLEYLRALKNRGKPLVLILTGGSPIAVPDDIADAILFVWYSGQAGGTAIADIIFGDIVPSGKLPITFPTSTAQLPPFEDYALKGRTYRYMTEKPLYPFGFGLSYTTFSFDSLTLDKKELRRGESVTATVKLTNTGSRDAEEVVQIYLTKNDRGPEDPLSSLRDFRRIALKAGSSLELHFTLPAGAFETVNEDGTYVLVPGDYTVTASDAAPVSLALERGAPSPVSASIRCL